MALSLEAEGRRFVYSGDAGLSDEIAALAEDADLLLHWCYRPEGGAVTPQMAALSPTPSQIGAMAKRCGARRLVLTHFRKHMDAPDIYSACQDAATRAFGAPVQIAEDLDTFTL